MSSPTLTLDVGCPSTLHAYDHSHMYLYLIKRDVVDSDKDAKILVETPVKSEIDEAGLIRQYSP